MVLSLVVVVVVMPLLFWRCGGGSGSGGGGGSGSDGWLIFFSAGSTSVAQYGLTCYVGEDDLELVAILLAPCRRC